MKILQDSREQKPYNFEGAIVDKLATGDYSLVGGQDMIAIERKSLSDLVSSLSTGRTRFKKELQRGKAIEHFALVVECSVDDILQHKYYSDMAPASVLQSLVAFSIRYSMPVWFAGDRAGGKHITASLLEKYYNEQLKRVEVIGQ